VKLLVVSPEFASHYTPLASIGAAAQCRGADVVVATGPAMASRVAAAGFAWRQLRMSAGSNPGILTRAGNGADATDMAGFFTATRGGMVSTLRYQADMRSRDLLWRPATVATAMLQIVAEEEPDAIVADHLAFACTLGLRVAGRRFTTFVPGHPSQLPVGDEIYGYPVAWPSCLEPADAELDRLWRRCEAVRDDVTASYNHALADLAPGAVAVDDAFAAHGDDVLYNAPSSLRDESRDALLPVNHRFLGCSQGSESLDPPSAEWVGALNDEPFVYVSLGTFLSARSDVLRRIIDALVELGIHAAIATGPSEAAALGAVPPDWLVAPLLPQVALLEHAAAAITHGGNNTVTEALRAGCPMVVLPFSTDQFATAADLERAGLATAHDPNRARRAELAPAIADAVASRGRREIVALADTLRRAPGPDIAADRLLDRCGRRSSFVSGD